MASNRNNQDSGQIVAHGEVSYIAIGSVCNRELWHLRSKEPDIASYFLF